MSREREDRARRNDHLMEMLLAGHTLEEAAAVYGITRERVRQIAVQRGVTRKDPVRRVRLRERRRTDFEVQHGDRVEKLWRGGLLEDDIAAVMGVPVDSVRRVVRLRTTLDERRARVAWMARGSGVPDEALFEALRAAAAQLGRSPGIKSYERLRREGVIVGPSGPSICLRMGWSEALERAGLPPNKQPRGLGLGCYSEDDYRRALARVAEAVGRPPSYNEYARLRRDGEPTAAAVRARFRGWLAAREQLLGVSTVHAVTLAQTPDLGDTDG